jgi:tRNA-splicing ligase RtcB
VDVVTATKVDDVLNWATDIEPQAMAQAQRVSRLPFVMKPVALMPDAHFGMGATVGSVIASQGAIIPAAVGVDIGCGMIAARLNLTSQSLPDDLGRLHGAIRDAVPAGVGKGHEHARLVTHPKWLTAGAHAGFTDKQINTAIKQMGTLGSGNHFVEVCLDTKDRVWVVLHSGSRGIGNQLAMEHIKNAQGLMKEWFVALEDPDLAYLPESTPAFDAYIADLLWAQNYALVNRQTMMDNVLKAIADTLFDGALETPHETINCHHNFTTKEHHHGRDIWITRKGAIRARIGDRGVIPGSMGTASYIVNGLGNPASYQSCSHGAGRKMGRNAAKKVFTIESLNEAMSGKTWNDRDATQLLDEHPGSYKDIDQVMENQKDLVQIDEQLHQILNYKGA